MGFFKSIFKRKKGGTMFGNLIRGVTNKASSGMLGTGSGLAAWEQKQAEKEQAQIYEQQMSQKKAFKVGSQLGEALKPSVDKALNSQAVADAKQNAVLAWAKKNWILILVLTAAIIGGIIWLVRRGNKGNSSNRRVIKR